MNKKVLGLAAVLLIAGVLALAATIYQERVAPPDLEDYHMKIPATGTYEWKTRSLEATLLGSVSVALGVYFLCLALAMRRRT